MNLLVTFFVTALLGSFIQAKDNDTPKGKSSTAAPQTPAPPTGGPTDTSACPSPIAGPSKGPKLPALDKMFIVNVQCNIINVSGIQTNSLLEKIDYLNAVLCLTLLYTS